MRRSGSCTPRPLVVQHEAGLGKAESGTPCAQSFVLLCVSSLLLRTSAEACNTSPAAARQACGGWAHATERQGQVVVLPPLQAGGSPVLMRALRWSAVCLKHGWHAVVRPWKIFIASCLAGSLQYLPSAHDVALCPAGSLHCAQSMPQGAVCSLLDRVLACQPWFPMHANNLIVRPGVAW